MPLRDLREGCHAGAATGSGIAASLRCAIPHGVGSCDVEGCSPSPPRPRDGFASGVDHSADAPTAPDTDARCQRAVQSKRAANTACSYAVGPLTLFTKDRRQTSDPTHEQAGSANNRADVEYTPANTEAPDSRAETGPAAATTPR